ncbi:MAG: hypothetical protein WBP26_02335 [Candidatus Saccharimonadales bacterium]
MLKKSIETVLTSPTPSITRHKTVKLFAAGMGLAGLSCLAVSAADTLIDYQKEAGTAQVARSLQQEAILKLAGKTILDSSISLKIIVLDAGPPDPATAYGNWATSVSLLCASELNQPACQESDIFETAEELDAVKMFAARGIISTEFSPWNTLDTRLTYTGLGMTAIGAIFYAMATTRQEQFEQSLTA